MSRLVDEVAWREADIGEAPMPSCHPTHGLFTIPRFALCCFAIAYLAHVCEAGDIPVEVQPKGYHTVTRTADGYMRDDELARYVCGQINANGGQVKDVKLFVQHCFGGGLLDDFQREFGRGGLRANTVWVGGAAAHWSERDFDWLESYCPMDDCWKNPSKLGCIWTSILGGIRQTPSEGQPGTIRSGPATNRVSNDIALANVLDRAEDTANREWGRSDRPVEGSGNGGCNVTWRDRFDGSGKHNMMLFSGFSGPRFYNNIANMSAALKWVWGGDRVTPTVKLGGGTDDLKQSISTACRGINADTQLLLYLTGHGGWEIDLGEINGWSTPHTITGTEKLPAFDVPQGYIEDPSSVLIELDLAEPINAEDWQLVVNGEVVTLGSGKLRGKILVKANLSSGSNEIRIESRREGAPPLKLNSLKCRSLSDFEVPPGVVSVSLSLLGKTGCNPNGRPATVQLRIEGKEAGAFDVTRNACVCSDPPIVYEITARDLLRLIRLPGCTRFSVVIHDPDSDVYLVSIVVTVTRSDGTVEKICIKDYSSEQCAGSDPCAKGQAGVDGKFVYDVPDGDGDGECDSCDGCSTDPDKQLSGDCGCNVPDQDGDGDGVSDCHDNCPDHYNPKQSDADGNGVGDTCEESSQKVCLYMVRKSKKLRNLCGATCALCNADVGDLLCTKTCDGRCVCGDRVTLVQACEDRSSCKVEAILVSCTTAGECPGDD